MHANEKLVLDMIRAVEERDMARLLGIYHPDVEFVWPPGLPYGGTYRGAEVVAMSERFAAAWQPLQVDEESRRFDPRILGSSAGEVAVLYRQRGRDSSGNSCETEVVGVYRVDDGHVVRLQMFYFDPEKIACFLDGSDEGRGSASPGPKERSDSSK